MSVPDRQPPSRELAPTERLPHLAVDVLIVLCAAKFLLHVFTSVRHYGYFRDELYYLDLARHLDWGYVDCAPLVAIYAKVALLMGGSLAALRLIPALAGTALVAIPHSSPANLAAIATRNSSQDLPFCLVPPS